MIGSFHGDTGGLATPPTLDIIKKIHSQVISSALHTRINRWSYAKIDSEA